MKFLTAPWLALWKRRNLLRQFSGRSLQMKHKGSFLGIVWMVLDPLLILGLYVFVFGFVFGGRFSEDVEETRLQYAITVFLGLAVFHLFAEVLAASANSILSQPNFVKKVVFPLETLPVVDCAVALVGYGMTMLLVVASHLLAGGALTWHALWLIYISLIFLIMLMGMAWIVSAVTVYLRDIGKMIQFVSMGVLFASAIFYPVSKIPDQAWLVLKYNPALHIIQASRQALIWHEHPSVSTLLWLTGASCFVFYIGYAVFQSLRDGFADVI